MTNWTDLPSLDVDQLPSIDTRDIRPSIEIDNQKSHEKFVGDGYRLLHGDVFEVAKTIPDHTFDLLIEDSPYQLSNDGTTVKSGKRVSVNKGEWDRSNGLYKDHEFNKAWLKECQRILKPSGTIWLSGTRHVIFSLGFALQELNYRILNVITWEKPTPPPNVGCRQFVDSTELLIWASPSQTKPLPHKFNYREMKEVTGKQMKDVWRFPSMENDGDIWTIGPPRKIEKEFGKHPTQKPVELCERMILSSSNVGDLVGDLFCGSGTTGVAALKLGRRFVGIDNDLAYLELASRRLAKVGG